MLENRLSSNNVNCFPMFRVFTYVSINNNLLKGCIELLGNIRPCIAENSEEHNVSVVLCNKNSANSTCLQCVRKYEVASYLSPPTQN